MIKIVVTVDDESMQNIDSVAQSLTAAGMKVEKVLRNVGTITGSCPESKKAELAAVKGIHSVEEDKEVRLSPPGSNIQ